MRGGLAGVDVSGRSKQRPYGPDFTLSAKRLVRARHAVPLRPRFYILASFSSVPCVVEHRFYFSEMLPDEVWTSTRALPSPMRARSSCFMAVPSIMIGISASMSLELERA